jgi:excisionase family DNA binding protein
MTDLLTLTVALSSADLDAIAERVAAILVERADPLREANYVTVPEAAALLGVTEKTIRNYVSSGRLTRHGAPRRPLVSREEVVALARGEGRQALQVNARRPSPRRPRAQERTFTSRARENR